MSKKERAAKNALKLLSRKDSRSIRRCKHWIREFGDVPTLEGNRLQVTWNLAVQATIGKWNPPSEFA